MLAFSKWMAMPKDKLSSTLGPHDTITVTWWQRTSYTGDVHRSRKPHFVPSLFTSLFNCLYCCCYLLAPGTACTSVHYTKTQSTDVISTRYTYRHLHIQNNYFQSTVWLRPKNTSSPVFWFGKASLTSNHNHFQPSKRHHYHSDVWCFWNTEIF